MLHLLKYLSSNDENYSVKELSQKLDLSYRTIFRYLDTLKAAGFAVVKLEGNIYKLGKMSRSNVDLDKLVFFSEDEAFIVNEIIDDIVPTNSLRKTLKAKLSTIYNSTSISNFINPRSNVLFVERLSNAIKNRKKVILKTYESGNSNSIRDRLIEPFDFTTEYIDVWAYDIEDKRNKIFKISRIGDVILLDEKWTEEKLHKRAGMDIFHMCGDTPYRVKMRLSMFAKNLLLEEYPLALKDLNKEGDDWILDTIIYDFAGICRFYVGLAREIQIIDSPEFQQYVEDYICSIKNCSI